ncbi:hypothetical protein GQX74_004575 [Glossina fuscipes]|nr:hypothetical protein GQX74_004575 [Glossina fuscipes]
MAICRISYFIIQQSRKAQLVILGWAKVKKCAAAVLMIYEHCLPYKLINGENVVLCNDPDMIDQVLQRSIYTDVMIVESCNGLKFISDCPSAVIIMFNCFIIDDIILYLVILNENRKSVLFMLRCATTFSLV